jgi:hypothetical protein
MSRKRKSYDGYHADDDNTDDENYDFITTRRKKRMTAKKRIDLEKKKRDKIKIKTIRKLNERLKKKYRTLNNILLESEHLDHIWDEEQTEEDEENPIITFHSIFVDLKSKDPNDKSVKKSAKDFLFNHSITKSDEKTAQQNLETSFNLDQLMNQLNKTINVTNPFDFKDEAIMTIQDINDSIQNKKIADDLYLEGDGDHSPKPTTNELNERNYKIHNSFNRNSGITRKKSRAKPPKKSRAKPRNKPRNKPRTKPRTKSLK